MGKPKFYLTTPVYYVNDVVHMGHAYSTIAADALARHKRQDGFDVHFLTGTDEHGVNIARAAEAHGVTPAAWCDRIVSEDRSTWEALEIAYDDFIRTTEPRHARAAQTLFPELLRRGHVYRGRYEGLYCAPCEAYYTESEAQESAGLCPVHARALERMSEPCFYLRVAPFVPQLARHVEEHPLFVRPESRRNEVRGLLAAGLPDLSISRTRVPWGVPVPAEAGGEKGETIYVWFEALVNYVTAAGYPDHPDRMARLWPADVHLIGKEIVKQHCVYWPIMLAAAGLPLPRSVFAHGWWTVEGRKISKTAGNVVDPRDIVRRFGKDAFRYFLLREIAFGADGDFSEKALVRRLNVDLANDFGNLLHRTLSMLGQYRQGRSPSPGADPAGFPERIARAVEAVRRSYDACAFDEALGAVWELAAAGNKYIEERSPWRLHKEGRTAELDAVLYNLLDVLRVMAVLALPVVPDASRAMWAQLGIPGQVDAAPLSACAYGRFPEGVQTQRPVPLFPRIEDAAPAGTPR